MKVLAGVNGTEQSCDALRFIARMLDPNKDSLVLYFSPFHVKVEHAERLLPNIPGDLQNELTKRVFSASLDALPEAFRESSVKLQGEKKAGEGLLIAAAQVKADLILVGADDKRRLPFYLGNVARSVSRNADCPVMVYRRPRHESIGPLRVMLAHDGSELATAAGSRLADFSWPKDSKGLMVRVIEWLDLNPETTLIGAAAAWRKEYDRQAEEIAYNARDRLRDVQSQLPAIFQTLDPEVISGSHVQALVDFAADRQVDLVVVGSRNLTTLHRLLGATTESLLHYAPCSVLVVHPQEKP